MPEAGPLTFFDKDTFPPARLTLADRVRVVPGGSAVRRGGLRGAGSRDHAARLRERGRLRGRGHA